MTARSIDEHADGAVGGSGAATGEGPSLTAAAVAQLVGGTLADGAAPADSARRVRRVAPLHRAGPDELTFLANPRYAALLATTGAGVALVAPDLQEAPGAPGLVRILVAKPHEALLRVLPALYAPPPRRPGLHPTAVLGRGVTLGAEVTVGPHAVIGDGATLGDRVWIEAHAVVGEGVTVGDDTHLLPHVTLYPGSVLGRRVTLHAGVRIGGDGFGYVFGDGQHRKIPHVGRCIVEDDVEIGCNTTIDRGSVDDTLIGAGTKIDNLVQIGHNCRIGRLCIVMSQVGIAGSTTVEDGVILAGQAGVGGHVTIGRGARVGGQSGVFGDVPAGETWSGYPARPHKESLRSTAALFRLAPHARTLERLAEREGAAPRPVAPATGGAA